MWSKIIRFIKWFLFGETAHADNTMNLTPIKIKIGLRPNGHADHPDWTKLPMITKDEETRTYAPFSWVYDKSCGHADTRTDVTQPEWDSPLGMQWGCMLTTVAFADEAITAYPDTISKITEAEFEDFYDTKARAHVSEFKYDMRALEALKLERDLASGLGQNLTDVETRIAKALDPDDPTKGKIRYDEKTFGDFKTKYGVTIV